MTTRYPDGRKVARRHIPNPSVSVGNLKQAAAAWVGGWDEDVEDDRQSSEELGGTQELPSRRDEAEEAPSMRIMADVGSSGNAGWAQRYGGTLAALTEGEEGAMEGASVAAMRGGAEVGRNFRG